MTAGEVMPVELTQCTTICCASRVAESMSAASSKKVPRRDISSAYSSTEGSRWASTGCLSSHVMREETTNVSTVPFSPPPDDWISRARTCGSLTKLTTPARTKSPSIDGSSCDRAIASGPHAPWPALSRPMRARKESSENWSPADGGSTSDGVEITAPPRGLLRSADCSPPPASPESPAAAACGGDEGGGKPSAQPSTAPTAAEKTAAGRHGRSCCRWRHAHPAASWLRPASALAQTHPGLWPSRTQPARGQRQ
eukprot:7391872-Prymnesium_polylepis.2